MVQWFQKRNSGTCIISPPYFVPSQDLDFQHHVVFFLCQVISVKVVWFMGFNATLNNISAISWRSVLLVGETQRKPSTWYMALINNFALDPIISPFDFHFRTFVTWLRENYDYRNVSWEMICIYDLTLSKMRGGGGGGGGERNTCSFWSLWVTLPLNLFFPTHFVLFSSALIWAVDGTVCPAEYALYHPGVSKFFIIGGTS